MVEESYSLYELEQFLLNYRGISCSPDYCPPNMRWIRQGVYVPAGRYFKAGPRIAGQYVDYEGMTSYWTLNEAKYAYLHQVVSGWDSSGIQGCNYQGWQSVFLVGDGDDPKVIITPFAEVLSVSYDGPSDQTTVVLVAPGTFGMTAKMQANFSPYPFRASASSVYNTDHDAWKAFARINWTSTHCWYSGGGTPQWLKYDFGLPRKLARYNFRARNYSDDPSPKTWTLQGSNDDSNWYTVDSQTNVADPGQNNWMAGFNPSTRDLYRYYRVYVTASQGSAVSIGEVRYKCGTDLRFDNARLIHIPLDPYGETAGYIIGVTNPGDPLVLSGDHINSGAKLQAGSILQVAPPTDVPSLYLGCCMIGEHGCMERYIKKGWSYTWTRSFYTDEGYKSTSSFGTTFIGDGVPPTATIARLYNFGGQDDSESRSGMVQIYAHGTDSYSGGTVMESEFNPEGSYGWRSQEPYIQWPMSFTMRIRNLFRSHQYGTWYVPEYAFMSFNGFIE